VIAGVIGGVGFLGAGSIIQSRGSIHGLTTAASIWLAAAIGVACGLRYYEIAVTTVVLALCILFFLGIVESKWLPEQEKVQPAEPEKTDGE
jgi:putative Mg2+ transporter-C (MgtC) family protein